jgi:pimeloyl-ACP methyl ester carboxylesterase
VAGRFAGVHPELVDRLVLFGPIGRRTGSRSIEPPTPWHYITVAEQHARFIGSVPRGAPGVLIEQDFPRWAAAYLASDPTSGTRVPQSVKTPGGPEADIADAWSGRFPYDPGRIRAPVLIVRGEWDVVSPDADMAWLKSALTGAAQVAEKTIPSATHLMHLEEGRQALYVATNAFLTADEGR